MNRELFNARSVQLALGALVLMLALTGWTASRAFRVAPVTASAAPVFVSAGALAKPGMVVPPDVGGAVSQNIFSPDRKAPAVRYRLTGYTDAAPVAPPPQPVVLGTFVAGNRSFAYCSAGDSRATVVRVGDIIGGYTVKSIERGLVVFSTPAGERLVITAK